MIGAANTRSRGMAFGEVDSMEECERAVRTAIQGAQKMANLRVDHVIVGFSGGRPRSYGVAGEVEVENGTVAERDIGAVLASCDVPDYGHDREALHALPVNFALDGRSGLTDPRGQIGRDLAVDMHLVTVGAAPLRNILHCVRRCDLELGGIVVSSYASGVASLVEDEQELGAACVDIGAGATGVSIFLRRQMIYSDAVRMGGQHVTSDISQGLQVSMQDAERLKTMHGGLVATGLDDRDMIELPSILGDWDNDRRQVSRTELIGVMRPRVEEILEEVRARLDASGFEYLPSQRIVLTGGSRADPGARVARGAHPRAAVPDRQAAQGSGAAAVGHRHVVLDRGRPRHARLPPAGRMLGLRDAGRPARGAAGGARASMVQGQLVTSGRSLQIRSIWWKTPIYCGCYPDSA